MIRWVLIISSTLVCAAVLFSAAQDQGLPDGKGKETLLKMCVQCHGLEQVTDQKRSKRRWTDIVSDMVSRGAEGSDEDAAAVISYLTRNFGKPVNINTSSAEQIEAGLSFTATESETLVRYRADHGEFKTYDDLVKVPGLNAALLEEQKKNIQF